MSTTKLDLPESLPRHFEELVALFPPQAILNDDQYEEVTRAVDRLMASGRLTKGQSHYLETLVQLVQAYESPHHAIDVSDIRGVETLRHLLQENSMNASDLARLLGVHVSMGSKILNGDRSLTLDHVRRLADRFQVSPAVFID
jgi:HTH-type transcriptional regulator / antitoxin HigA